jgi:hypothetical protein
VLQVVLRWTLATGLCASQARAKQPKHRANHKQIVPACKPFSITWQPTTPNTVSVLLLKGPATNVVKFGPSLAEGIANSGSLAWTPSADLEATTGPNGYGIQIIDDVTGQYQYSTQFGISLDSCVVVSSSVVPVSSAAPASSSAEGYPVASSTPAVHSSKASSSAAGYPTAPAGNGTSAYPTKSGAAPVYSTGAAYGNSSVVLPTKSMTVPTTLRPTASSNVTTSRLPEATGAASAIQAGLSLAGLAAAFAFML